MTASTRTEDLLRGLRGRCLALPEVTEDPTHGAPTWFVHRRSFVKFVDPAGHRLPSAASRSGRRRRPGARDELIAADPEQYFVPRFGGREWVGMRLDTPCLDWAEVGEIVTDAYRQVAPRFLVARLDHAT